MNKTTLSSFLIGFCFLAWNLSLADPVGFCLNDRETISAQKVLDCSQDYLFEKCLTPALWNNNYSNELLDCSKLPSALGTDEAVNAQGPVPVIA